MTADKPSSAEGWALVDFMANVITDTQDAPHFTTAEHALMSAGELERDWLAAHDRAVKAEALREAAGWVHDLPWTQEDVHNAQRATADADWLDGANDGVEFAARKLCDRADQIEKGDDT